MTPLENLMVSELGSAYTPTTHTYSILSPAKAAQRLAAGGWTKEKEVVRRHANGNDEYLTILSKPTPKPAPPPTPTPTPKLTAAERVKEAIRGSRNSSR